MGIYERKQREKAQRKIDIINAARKIFSNKGFNSATMEEIALEADVVGLAGQGEALAHLQVGVLGRPIVNAHAEFAVRSLPDAHAVRLHGRLGEALRPPLVFVILVQAVHVFLSWLVISGHRSLPGSHLRHLGLELHQAAVKSARLQQFLVGADLGQLAALQHDQAVGLALSKGVDLFMVTYLPDHKGKFKHLGGFPDLLQRDQRTLVIRVIWKENGFNLGGDSRNLFFDFYSFTLIGGVAEAE